MVVTVARGIYYVCPPGPGFPASGRAINIYIVGSR